MNIVDTTIIAQCSPKGSGAIALLRLSGPEAIKIAALISKIPGQNSLLNAQTHTIHYGWVVNGTEYIDQVLFMLMKAPRTFTGEDVVEITCHNNPFIIEAILHQALKHGAQMAQEGEFSKRAVLNGKIDLIQAEAINELIHANTQLALKKSLAQVEGSFSSWITHIEHDLFKALAFSQASFEFIDEEMEFGSQIKTFLTNTRTTIESLLKTFNQQQQIRQGVRIALIGSVNAGKSSLFNALLNKERSIVTAIAGTTRDAIEAGVYRNGNYWTLVDTAGLRHTDDVIEAEGIKRSYAQAQEADVILLVIDGSRATTPSEVVVCQELLNNHAHKIIPVLTKQDLATHHELPFIHDNPLHVSSTTKTNIPALEVVIEEKIGQLFKDLDSPFLLNQRQFNLLLSLNKKLEQLMPMLDGTVAYELISYHLNDALEHLAQLTGKSVSERGMDLIFKEFCVGK